MQMGNPTSTAYKNASQYLYGQLSGDLNYNGIRDNTTMSGTTALEPAPYLAFRPDQLGKQSGNNNKILFLQDPYGNSYGYSTAAATDEECFQTNLRAGGATVARPASKNGFNTTFDLWSTGGRTVDPSSGSDPNQTWSRWVKNW